jgi:hypothetical protein
MVVCKWRILALQEDEYITACGNFWRVEHGTPVERGLEFCPYCGRSLELIPSEGRPLYDVLTKTA